MTCCDVPMALFELSQYYDGALFFICERCGRCVHRFPADHRLCDVANRAARDGGFTIHEAA